MKRESCYLVELFPKLEDIYSYSLLFIKDSFYFDLLKIERETPRFPTTTDKLPELLPCFDSHQQYESSIALSLYYQWKSDNYPIAYLFVRSVALADWCCHPPAHFRHRNMYLIR
jgi:hypothetical protein